jgi:hypothetical protein
VWGLVGCWLIGWIFFEFKPGEGRVDGPQERISGPQRKDVEIVLLACLFALSLRFLFTFHMRDQQRPFFFAGVSKPQKTARAVPVGG